MARPLKYGNREIIHSRLYRIWSGIINRCANREDYAGKGISICEQWRNDFLSFETWSMSNGYADDLQIDRIDNSGDYAPENCRWVTAQENCLNRDRAINLNGKSTEQVGQALGLTRQSIRYRIRVLGMSPEEAATTPKTPNGGLRKHFRKHNAHLKLGKWEDDK